MQTELPDGRAVEAMGGWDRPLRGYHFGVYLNPPPDDPEESEVVYDNLDDLELLATMGFAPDNEHFKKRAAELGLQLPDTFWSLCDRQEANTVYTVQPNGEFAALNL